MKAIDYYHQAVAYSARGAREMDADLFNKATELMLLGNREMVKVYETIPKP